MGKIIGIDLGTTNAVVCVMEGNQPKVIPHGADGSVLPSVVRFDEDGSVSIGRAARRGAILSPEKTVLSVTRLLGLPFADVQSEISLRRYPVVCAPDGNAEIKIHGKTHSPPEVVARVLMQLKKTAEGYLRELVTEAVIAVPTYFNDSQRQATRDAARLAGLRVHSILDHPSAAALACGLGGTPSAKVQFVAVYHLGGATCCTSILKLEQNVEVLSTRVDLNLGGDEFDQRIVQWLIAEFAADTGLDISTDRVAVARLNDAAEKAKIELSAASETQISLPFLTVDFASARPKGLEIRLNRDKFEQLIGDLVTRSIDLFTPTLADARRSVGQIDRILLIGGSSSVPMVQLAVGKLFSRLSPTAIGSPAEVAGLGAAVYGTLVQTDRSSPSVRRAPVGLQPAAALRDDTTPVRPPAKPVPANALKADAPASAATPKKKRTLAEALAEMSTPLVLPPLSGPSQLPDTRSGTADAPLHDHDGKLNPDGFAAMEERLARFDAEREETARFLDHTAKTAAAAVAYQGKARPHTASEKQEALRAGVSSEEMRTHDRRLRDLETTFPERDQQRVAHSERLYQLRLREEVA